MYKFIVYPSFGYCAKIPSSLKRYHKTGNSLEKGIKGEALEARNSFLISSDQVGCNFGLEKT